MKFMFVPLKGISTYELALATKFMIELIASPSVSREGVEKQYESLPESVKRHFKTAER